MGEDFKADFIDQITATSDPALVAAAFAQLYSDFHQGGALDAQPYATGNAFQKASYGNYTFGVFMAAAGVSEDDALTAASLYGYKQQYVNGAYQDRAMDPVYGGIPSQNVRDIQSGYTDYASGTIHH